ncbi:MAG: hypothetical protein JXR95_04695 [Deltaproteobacteria bacterium]|nr:hypothetical protein [Deltaproteobacteria bacterium]
MTSKIFVSVIVFGIAVSCMNVGDYLQSGNFEKAARHCNSLKKSEQSECWYEMGKAAESIKKFFQALEYYRYAKNPEALTRVQGKIIKDAVSRGERIFAASYLEKTGSKEKALKLYRKIASEFNAAGDFESAFRYYELAGMAHMKDRMSALIIQKFIREKKDHALMIHLHKKGMSKVDIQWFMAALAAERRQYHQLSTWFLLSGRSKSEMDNLYAQWRGKPEKTESVPALKGTALKGSVFMIWNLFHNGNSSFALRIIERNFHLYSKHLVERSENLEKSGKYQQSGFFAAISNNNKRATRLFGLSLDKEKFFKTSLYYLANTDRNEFLRRMKIYSKINKPEIRKTVDLLDRLYNNKKIRIHYYYSINTNGYKDLTKEEIRKIISVVEGKFIKNKNIKVVSMFTKPAFIKLPDGRKVTASSGYRKYRRHKPESVPQVDMTVYFRVNAITKKKLFNIRAVVGINSLRIVDNFLITIPMDKFKSGKRVKSPSLNDLAQNIADFPNLTIFRRWINLHSQKPKKVR